MRTLEQAKELADSIANYAHSVGVIAEMEVAKAARLDSDGEIYRIQPAGFHMLYKTQRLIYTTQTPKE